MINNFNKKIIDIKNQIDKIKFKKSDTADILTKIEEFEKNNQSLSELSVE